MSTVVDISALRVNINLNKIADAHNIPRSYSQSLESQKHFQDMAKN